MVLLYPGAADATAPPNVLPGFYIDRLGEMSSEDGSAVG